MAGASGESFATSNIDVLIVTSTICVVSTDTATPSPRLEPTSTTVRKLQNKLTLHGKMCD